MSKCRSAVATILLAACGTSPPPCYLDIDPPIVQIGTVDLRISRSVPWADAPAGTLAPVVAGSAVWGLGHLLPVAVESPTTLRGKLRLWRTDRIGSWVVAAEGCHGDLIVEETP